MKRVLLGLGSNNSFKGMNSLDILKCSESELKKYLSNVVFSSVYKTKAMYVEKQDDFYNMAAVGFVEDSMNAFDFLKIINSIEAKYGRDRKREIRFGPRPLDIDIELFGDEEINHPILQIPHVRMKERAFVLVPALEVLDDSADFEVRKKCSIYLANLEQKGLADGIVKL